MKAYFCIRICTIRQYACSAQCSAFCEIRHFRQPPSCLSEIFLGISCSACIPHSTGTACATIYSPVASSQVDEDKEAKKLAAARAVLAGRSFTEGEDDPFEGLGPQEIQAYIDKALEGVSHSDPFEVLCINRVW